MKRFLIGTAGHIDHGKTALVKALTGIDADRLPEEKRRGITIDLGFAHAEWEGVRMSFVDVPGHERFVRNMLAGAGGIEAVLLVVAADESVMPQTREHFEIVRMLGLIRAASWPSRRATASAPELVAVTVSDVRELVAGLRPRVGADRAGLVGDRRGSRGAEGRAARARAGSGGRGARGAA